MDREAWSVILEEGFLALEAGAPLDREALLRRHPRHEAEVDDVLRVLSRFAASTTTRGEGDGEAQPVPGFAWLAPGEHLGDFEVGEVLGSGGMGVVYAARQVSLRGREVALKVQPGAGEDAAATRRFRRGAEVLAGLHHPSLPEVYGFGEERGLLYLAMRLVEGPTLAALLPAGGEAPAGRPAPEDRGQIVQWIADVAGALALLHRNGLVHRDVKPSNILLEGCRPGERIPEGGRAVLVDFGVARPLRTETLTSSGAGVVSLAYAPAEQLLGGRAGIRADVFSLGVTLHDLLTGTHPTARPRAAAGLEPLQDRLPDIHPDLAAVVAKATDPMARWRYADASEFLADLRAWLHGLPVSARRPPLGERLRRGWHRNSLRILRLVPLTLAVAAAMAAAGILAHWTDHAARLRHAARTLDLVALAEDAGGIPPVLRGWFLRDPSLRGLLDRLVRGDPSDPLRGMVDRLEHEDRGGALWIAAAHARVRGLASDPWVARFLEAALAEQLQRPGGGGNSSLEEITPLFVLARLFYERPDASPRDAEASEGIRELLRRVFLEARGAPQEWRLLAATALSGCGGPEDAEELLADALDRPPWSEEQRLGFLCVERIVRRGHEAGTLGGVALAEMCARVMPPALSAMEFVPWRPTTGLDATRFWGASAVLDLGRALAVALGEGERSELTRRLRAAHLAERARAQGPYPLPGAAFLAALGDPNLLAALEAVDGWGLDRPAAREWGRVAGLFARNDVRERLVGLVRTGGNVNDPPRPEDVEQGFRHGMDERIGIRSNLRPDPESLLGAQVHLDGGALRPIAMQSVPSREAVARSALWEFAETPVRVEGTAIGAACREAERYHVGPVDGFVRLPVAGRSELRLRFDLPEEAGPLPLTLHLNHLAAMRIYYPFGGEVQFEVAVDDRPIYRATLPVREFLGQRSGLPGIDVIPIPAMALGLGPGPHEIRIRSTDRSTTVYWIKRAELRW